MVPSKLSFAQYSEMDEQQRQDYAQSWVYIREHNKK